MIAAYEHSMKRVALLNILFNLIEINHKFKVEVPTQNCTHSKHLQSYLRIGIPSPLPPVFGATECAYSPVIRSWLELENRTAAAKGSEKEGEPRA